MTVHVRAADRVCSWLWLPAAVLRLNALAKTGSFSRVVHLIFSTATGIVLLFGILPTFAGGQDNAYSAPVPPPVQTPKGPSNNKLPGSVPSPLPRAAKIAGGEEVTPPQKNAGKPEVFPRPAAGPRLVIPAVPLVPALPLVPAIPVFIDVEAVQPAAAVAVAKLPPGEVLIKKRIVWKYWDQADDPGADWASSEFDDSRWAEGQGPLGYGDQHIKTKVAFGDKPNNKNLVVFFRRALEVDDPSKIKRIAGSIMCDDAAAIYINGKEVYRHNLAAGELKLSTRSSRAISGAAERVYWEFTTSGDVLRKGKNTVAVRVHQTNRTSSDLGFDLEMRSVTEQVAKGVAVRMKRNARVARPPMRAAQRAARNFVHVTDGDIKFAGPDGVVRTQQMDAIDQARSYAPAARFVRTIQGDTLAKLAAQHKVDPQRLAALNRVAVGKVYSTPDIACISWTRVVRPTDTLSSLAKEYNVSAQYLAEMNAIEANDVLRSGSSLSVPGEFSYHYRTNGRSYMRLARYQNVVQQNPFKPQSMKMRREKLKKGQDLKAFAEKMKVTEEFLRTMNSLKEDDDLGEERWMLVEYSVELSEGATLDQLAQFFGVQRNAILQLNGLDDGDVVQAGQRLEIPIGARMHGGQRQVAVPTAEPKMFEVVFEAEP